MGITVLPQGGSRGGPLSTHFKHQTTIPKVVREALGLGKGDYVLFELDDHRHLSVRKAAPADVEYIRAMAGTLTEWLSPADEEAYGDL